MEQRECGRVTLNSGVGGGVDVGETHSRENNTT